MVFDLVPYKLQLLVALLAHVSVNVSFNACTDNHLINSNHVLAPSTFVLAHCHWLHFEFHVSNAELDNTVCSGQYC